MLKIIRTHMLYWQLRPLARA
uniref:Uncharacterized protein n=1 Tax=Rhizophora mucronata TaxID=61149 RepID=A0A2P2J3F9_RHIMU